MSAGQVARRVPDRPPAERAPLPPCCLAAIDIGQSVVIRRILFDSLRVECAGAEFREGDRVECVAAGDSQLILRTASGRQVACDRGWARFVEVGSAREVRGQP